MRTVNKEEILVPILEKYYPSFKPFIENESLFYKEYDQLIRSDDKYYLKEEFGVAILIINILSTEKTKTLLALIEKNKKFEISKSIGTGNRPEIDEVLFDEDAKFSFKRSVFKCKEKIRVAIAEKNSKMEKEPIFFTLYISIVSAEKINHNIITYIFTTHDNKEVYIKLSSYQIVNLIKDKKSYFIEAVKKIDKDLASLFIIDKNSFKGLNLWRPEWRDGHYELEVFKYIKENPYYYFSLLTMKKDIFRRNFKNIMDYLGWGFSASKVHCGLFSRNLYISITLKPLKNRYDYIGHDGTEFRAWEILALQNYLLNRIDICYEENDINTSNESDGLVKELNEVYDFNAFFKKIGKGEIWIKFNRYLQDAIGISSYYELYINRHNRMRQEKDSAEILKLTKTSTKLSGLIFATIFLTIIIFFIERVDIKCKDLLGNFSPCQLLDTNNSPIFGWSILLTLILSAIFIYVFEIYLKHADKISKIRDRISGLFKRI